MKPVIVTDVDAYQVFDSRGNPTVEAVVQLEDGSVGRGIAPSGASTGKYEALERRDRIAHLYRGKSVVGAVEAIRQEIAPAIRAMGAADQLSIDTCMINLDGTPNKSRLGANAILAVSMAFCNASATAEKRLLFEHLGKGQGDLLPLPEIQLFGGGAHAAQAIDIQDIMIIATAAVSFEHALEITFNVYHETATMLQERGLLRGVADEGGFWPSVRSNEEVLDLVLEAIQRAGYRPGDDVAISLDIAASNLFRNGEYVLRTENCSYNASEFRELLFSWIRNYPIVSIEDPLMEDDWHGWQEFTEVVGGEVQVIGDDLFTTNLDRIRRGIDRRSANAVLIKPNQVGTVSETLAAIELTQKANWNPVISARSGETEDAFISHLAVAVNAGQLKVGSFSRSERMVKWNEVLRIHRRLGDRARFIGRRIFRCRNRLSTI
jgi:enolase